MSAPLSCSLPAPAARIPGPAIPCTTAPTLPRWPSLLPALPGFFAALRSPSSSDPAIASPRSRAIPRARNCPARTGWPRVPPASTASVCPAPPTAPAPPAPPALAAGCIARAPASPSSATETLPCPCGSRDLSAIFPVARTTRSSTALLLRLPRSLHLLQPLQVPLLALPELLLGRRRATAPTRSSTFPVLHPAQLRLRHPHLHLRQILRPVRRSLHRDRRHQARPYHARRYQVRRQLLPHRRPQFLPVQTRCQILHRRPALRLWARHH